MTSLSASAKKRKTFLVKTMVSKDRVKELQTSPDFHPASPSKKFSIVNSLVRNTSKTPLVTQNSFPKKDEISPEGDLQEKDEVYDEKYFSEYAGPQLKMNKTHLSFIEKAGNLARDSVAVTNNGSTAIYYRWKKLDNPVFFDVVVNDKEERFFCHAGKNVIKPGQIRTFNFTFKSRCTGIFEEEWILECEPPLIQALPAIRLSGHSIKDDPNVEWRSELDMIMDARHKNRFISEIINDVLDQVRTPTPPLPDLDNPEVCKREFEEKNAKYHLYYTPVVMNLYRNLQSLIYEELHLTTADTYWDLNIDFLQELINRVRENATRENFLRRYNDLLVLAKKKPLDRSSAYDYIKNALQSMIKELPTVANNVRREKDIMEVTFSEPVDLSPEDLKKKQDEEAKAKAEFAKKQKKKPKNEEEERKIYEEYRTQLASQITQPLTQVLGTLEDNDSAVRAINVLKTGKRPGKEYFESLAMKKSIKDLDMEEKRIVVRVHLKLKPKVEVQPTEEELAAIEAEKIQKAKEEELQKKQAKSGKEQKTKKTKEQIAEELAIQKEEEEKKQFIENVDEKSLAEALNVVKTCLEQLAKLVIVLVSFGEPHGKPNPATSTKHFWTYMRDKLDQICNFEEACKIEDFQERFEADREPQNSALILENIFHLPEEVGYVYNDDGTLVKLDDWQMQGLANELAQYASVYLIEDKYNLFKNYASLTKVQTETTLLGPSLSADLVLVPQAFLHSAFEPKKSSSRRKKDHEEEALKKINIAVVGGEFSADVLVAIDTILGFYDQVFVMGQVGIYFLMFKAGLKSFGGYTINPHQQTLLEKVIANAVELGKTIFVPEKLILAPKPEVKEDVPEWITSIYNTRFVWPDGYEQYLKDLAERAPPVEEQPKKDAKKVDPKDKKGDPKNKAAEEPPADEAGPGKGPGANFLIVGYEPSFLQGLESEIYNARNILWIGSLEPLRHAGLNEANQSLALTIYNVKEERKPKILQNAIPIDWLVSCVGEDLQEALNSFDISNEQAPVGQNRRPSGVDTEGLSGHEEEKSAQEEVIASRSEIESQSKGGQAERRNNIVLIADAYSTNREFALKLIGGEYLETLNLITGYEKKNEDEEEEEFSFIDEI